MLLKGVGLFPVASLLALVGFERAGTRLRRGWILLDGDG